MNIVSVSSPVFAAADGSAIDCLVVFKTPSGELTAPTPFTAVATDGVEYGAALFERLASGEFGPVGPYTPPPPPVPRVISDRQFFQLLTKRQVISTQEALAAVGPGVLPERLATFIAALPESQQFDAQMLLVGATQYDRNHPIVPVFAQLFGWGPAELDTFWLEASQL